MMAKTLVSMDSFQNKSIGLADGKIQLLYNFKNFANYFFVQFCICGVSHVLFLHGRVYKGSIMMLLIALTVIHTDAFSKNKLYAFFSYTFTKMNKFDALQGKDGVNSCMPQKY